MLIGVAELRIVDPETLADRPDGTPGELLARGPEMFAGYLDASLDDAAFVDGGWFRTGDLAVYDGEYLTIIDRLKDVIIRGGENIGRRRSRRCSSTTPPLGGSACCRARSVMGERVCAFVITAARGPGSRSTTCANTSPRPGLPGSSCRNDWRCAPSSRNRERQGAEGAAARRAQLTPDPFAD